MFLEILSGTKTIFSEGEEDGHLERRETLQTGLKEMYLFHPSRGKESAKQARRPAAWHLWKHLCGVETW